MAGAEAEELAVLEDAEQAAEFADLEDLAGLGIPEELLEMERKSIMNNSEPERGRPSWRERMPMLARAFRAGNWAYLRTDERPGS